MMSGVSSLAVSVFDKFSDVNFNVTSNRTSELPSEQFRTVQSSETVQNTRRSLFSVWRVVKWCGWSAGCASF